jgi:aminoglycoside 6'-N-acetyltransferase I
MVIKEIGRNNTDSLEQLKILLVDAFPHSYADCADEEVETLISDDRILIGAFNNDTLLGFVSAIPQYDFTGWELHPIVVKKEQRYSGIGTMLLKALEDAIALKGGITIYLGTDDEFYKTSLSGVDLYEDMYEKIKNVKNIRKHPYEFYEKNGYKITGVIPDANGFGKPDIIMAKRIRKFNAEEK